jgi:superfamily I DNA and/or RNA helicase
MQGLATCGMDVTRPGGVGVVSPLPAQVCALQDALRGHGADNVAGFQAETCEVSTMDRSHHGHDTKDALILSTATSIDAMPGGGGGVDHAGDPLNVLVLDSDSQRVNVALSCARRKLIVVGSSQQLMKVPMWHVFVELMKQRGWVYDL